MKKFLNRLWLCIIWILVIYFICDKIYPYETSKVISTITNSVEKISSDDTVYLTQDDESSLYKFKAKVNGVEFDFILDTGCTSMFMSNIEFMYMKRRGVITDDDYLGDVESTNADGDVSICSLYNIRELEIGGYVIRNVQCGVSNSHKAELLIGQEVLSKFKTITIDYSNHTLTLNR